MSDPPSPETDPAAAPVILLVEDEETIVALLTRYLQRAGFQVEVCGSGQEAVDRLGADPARFHSAVVDLNLPDSNGPVLLTRLWEVRPNLTVIGSSGLPFRASEPPPASARFCFLQKPYHPDRLLDLLRAVSG